MRIFGEAFVGAAPPLVLRHGDARTEGPIDAGGANFFGGDSADATDEIGVARAAEADVVREDHGAEHVAVAVDRVDAVDDRNAKPRLEGVLLALVVDIGPGFEAVALLRIGAAAAENRADEILFDVAEVVLDVLQLGLGHLADFFVERHLRDDWLDQGIEGGVVFRLSGVRDVASDQRSQIEATRRKDREPPNARERTTGWSSDYSACQMEAGRSGSWAKVLILPGCGGVGNRRDAGVRRETVLWDFRGPIILPRTLGLARSCIPAVSCCAFPFQESNHGSAKIPRRSGISAASGSAIWTVFSSNWPAGRSSISRIAICEASICAGLDLAKVRLRGSYLRDADLRGVDLRHVDMEGCSLYHAKISGAYFPTNLSAAEISMSVQYGTRVRCAG